MVTVRKSSSSQTFVGGMSTEQGPVLVTSTGQIVGSAAIPNKTFVSGGGGGGGDSAPMSTEQGPVLVTPSGEIVGSAALPSDFVSSGGSSAPTPTAAVPGLSIMSGGLQQQGLTAGQAQAIDRARTGVPLTDVNLFNTRRYLIDRGDVLPNSGGTIFSNPQQRRAFEGYLSGDQAIEGSQSYSDFSETTPTEQRLQQSLLPEYRYDKNLYANPFTDYQQAQVPQRGTINQQPTTQYYKDYKPMTNVELLTGAGKAVGTGAVNVGKEGVNLLSIGMQKTYDFIYEPKQEKGYGIKTKYTLQEPVESLLPYQTRGTAGSEYKPLFEIISPISDKMIRQTTPYEKLKGKVGDLFPGITIPSKQELKETFGVKNIAETSGELWKGWDLLAEKTGGAWEGISEKVGLGKVKFEAGSIPIGKKETIIDYKAGKKDVTLIEPVIRRTSYGKGTNGLITFGPLDKEYPPVQQDNVFRKIEGQDTTLSKVIGIGAKEYTRFAPWIIGGTTKAGLGLLSGSATLPIIKGFGEAGKTQIQSEESLLKAYKPMDMSDKEWKTYLDSSDGDSIKQQVQDYRKQQEESISSQKAGAMISLASLGALPLLPVASKGVKFFKKELFGREIIYKTAPKEVELVRNLREKPVVYNIELTTGEIVQAEVSVVKGLGRTASTGRKIEMYEQSGWNKLLRKEPEVLTRKESIKILKKKGYEDKEIQKILRTQRPKIAIQNIEGKIITAESDLLEKPINIFKGTITETPQIIKQARIKSRKFTPTRTYVELSTEQIGMFGETQVSYGQGIKEKVFVAPSKVNLGGGQGEFMKLSQRGKTQELFEQVGGSTGMKEGEVLQLGKSTLKQGELFIPTEFPAGKGTIYGYKRFSAEGYTQSSIERTLLPKRRAISKGNSKLVNIKTEPLIIDIKSPIRAKKDIPIDLGVPKKGSEVKFTKEQAKELTETLRDIYGRERGFKPPRRSPSRIKFTKEQAKEITKDLRDIYGRKGELELKITSQKGQTLIPQVAKVKERPIIQYKPTKVPEAYEFYPKIVGGLGRSQSQFYGKGRADMELTEPLNLKSPVGRSETTTSQLNFQTLSYQPIQTKTKDTQLFGITNKEAQLLKSAQIEVERTRQLEESVLGFKQVQTSMTIQRPQERLREATVQVPATKLIPRLRTPQLFLPRLTTYQAPRTPQVPRPYKPGVPFIPILDDEGRKRRFGGGEKGQLYFPVVRRYGKFFSLAGESTPQGALAKGKQFALTTLGASVRVRSKSGFIPIQAGAGFRPAKRDIFTIVQTRERRLQSPYERMEIKKSRQGRIRII